MACQITKKTVKDLPASVPVSPAYSAHQTDRAGADDQGCADFTAIKIRQRNDTHSGEAIPISTRSHTDISAGGNNSPRQTGLTSILIWASAVFTMMRFSSVLFSCRIAVIPGLLFSDAVILFKESLIAVNRYRDPQKSYTPDRYPPTDGENPAQTN